MEILEWVQDEPVASGIGVLFWLFLCLVIWKWHLWDSFSVMFRIALTAIGLPVSIAAAIFGARRAS